MNRIIISMFLFVAVISAQWSTDPATPQSLGSGVQAQLAATSDGGVYVAWLSDGNYHVYLQRLNSLGEPQLGNNGMVVSDNANASWIAVFHLNLAVDSEDNAIITTVDQRTGGQWEVYAYKIAPDGSMPWGTDGLALSVPGSDNISPRLTVLSDNSVAVAWCQNYNTVRIQRISESGALQWGDGGIHIEDSTGDLLNPLPLTVDGTNILLQWNHQSGPFWAPDSKLYLQKYNSSGIGLWGSPLVAVGPVVFPTGNYSQESVGDGAGGSFSAWTQMAGSNQSAIAQRISGTGEIVWGNAVDFSTNSSHFRTNPRTAVAEGNSELMAAWTESNGSQSQRGVYAQRLDSNGNRLWGNNGTAVVALNSNYDYLDLSVAGFGDDLIAAYIEQSVNTNGDIYAVRLDANGNDFWDSGTVTVTNSSSPKSDMMIDKGPGCLFIAWTENASVYIHCLRDDGTLGAPDAGVVLLVPSEYPTIQAAIDSANDGDMVLVAAGTYVENIDYNGKNIVVQGENRETTIIDGNQAGGVVTISSSSDAAQLEGFTIFNGQSSNGGGIYIDDSSTVILSDLVIEENISTGQGGGVFISASDVELNNVIITDNHAMGDGGGLYIYSNSNVDFTECFITDNLCDDDGGGLKIHNTCSVIFSNSELIANTAADKGGAIVANNYSDVTFDSSVIANNNAVYGAAFRLRTGTVLNLSNSVVAGNTAGVSGAVVYAATTCSLNVSYSTITDNENYNDDYSIIYLADSYDAQINHSIIWNEDEIEIGNDGSGVIDIQYSCILGGSEGLGNIEADPLFCDPDSSDYTLAENSPCIGSGENGANIGAFGEGCGIIGPYILLTNDSLIVLEDSSSTINLLDNDLIIDVTTFTLAIVDSADNGTVVIIGDSVIIYTPYENFFGYDTLSYSVFSGETADTGLVLITVTAIADAPSSFALNEQDSVYITMANFDSDSISFTWDESIDVDGDELLYDFTASLIVNGQVKAEYDSSSLTDRIMKIDYQSVFDEIYAAQAMLAGIEWDVSVSDGEEEVMAENGPLTVGINASDAVLSIDEELLPDLYALHQNYPNPFNPITTLRYDLPENSHVNVTIYNMRGRQVKSLINQTQDAGYNAIIWNATNNYGKPVSAGVYLYQIHAGEFVQTRKMVLLK